MFYEGDPGMATVYIPVEVKNMSFQDNAFAVKGWALSEIGHTWIPYCLATLLQSEPDGIDA